jgi:hypothetical protein
MCTKRLGKVQLSRVSPIDHMLGDEVNVFRFVLKIPLQATTAAESNKPMLPLQQGQPENTLRETLFVMVEPPLFPWNQRHPDA